MENIFYSTGRRKESTARVFLSKGTGKITVNSNPIEKYFGRKTNIMVVKQALNLTETADKTDIKVTVKGGGSSGQAGAIKLGIARALYKKPKILILDEGTNSIDHPTELKIFNNVKKYFNEMTLIFITHRKESLRLCDKIYLLKDRKLSIVKLT